METGNAMDRVEAENGCLRDRRSLRASSSTRLAATVERVTEATGGDACFLHLWEPEQERLRCGRPLPFGDAVG
jgi:hypothetical protein